MAEKITDSANVTGTGGDAAVGRFTGFTSRTTGLCGPRNFHRKLYVGDFNILLYLGRPEPPRRQIALFYGENHCYCTILSEMFYLDPLHELQ